MGEAERALLKGKEQREGEGERVCGAVLFCLYCNSVLTDPCRCSRLYWTMTWAVGTVEGTALLPSSG